MAQKVCAWDCLFATGRGDGRRGDGRHQELPKGAGAAESGQLSSQLGDAIFWRKKNYFMPQGKVMDAIEEYHKALALRPEDSFAAEMLSVALREAVPYPDDMGIAFGP